MRSMCHANGWTCEYRPIPPTAPGRRHRSTSAWSRAPSASVSSAEHGGLAPQPAEPIPLFSKQRPHLGRVHSPKWRTERAAQRWRSPEERGVSDGGAREAAASRTKQWSVPHTPRGSKRLPTDPHTSRFCSPKKNGGGERSCSPAARQRNGRQDVQDLQDELCLGPAAQCIRFN